MAAQDCIDRIRAAAGDLSDDDLLAIVEQVDGLRRQKATEGTMEGLEAALLDATDELARNIEIAALIEKRNRAFNVIAKKRRMDFYATVDDKALAVTALNVGINRNITAGRSSVDARALAVETQLAGGFLRDLRRGNLIEAARHRDLQEDIAIELWEIREGGNPGRSGNAMARNVADIVFKHQEIARQLQNRAGAYIRKMPGYIVRQSHNPFLLRRSGFERWKADVIQELDHDLTFAGVENRDKFLMEAYTGLVSGEHMHAKGADDWLGGFKGPGNLAKRVSQGRTLHFKDGASWWRYNSAYGMGRVVDAVLFGFKRSADNAALMQVWGTNPEAAFLADLDQLALANRADVGTVTKLRDKHLRNQFDEVSGKTHLAENPTLARRASEIRALQSMAKLGGATVSSITDIPALASEIQFQGHGFLEGYGNALASLARGRGKGETREVMDLVGVGFDGFLGAIASRLSTADDLGGRMSKMTSIFFKLNGLSWWTDSLKAGVGAMMSRHLATVAGRSFDALPAETANLLRMFDIGEREWAAIRQATGTTADGRVYLTPDAIRDLPDDTIRAWLGKDAGAAAIARAKDELETRLRAYFTDRVNYAVLTSGARERAIANQGTRRGTIEGEAIRFIMQFKQFPITVLTKAMGREMARKSGKAPAIVHLMVAMTAMGYVAMSAKDVLKGREPRDPFDPKTWGAAFVQGGGAGIFGDFLFGEFNRFGNSFWSTALGPTAGTVEDFVSVLAAVRDGDEVAAKTFRTALSITPFANLFYTRIALDYLFLYQIQEMVNPGYLRRMEKNVKRNNNQAFILQPSRAIPHGGGGRIFEGVRE